MASYIFRGHGWWEVDVYGAFHVLPHLNSLLSMMTPVEEEEMETLEAWQRVWGHSVASVRTRRPPPALPPVLSATRHPPASPAPCLHHTGPVSGKVTMPGPFEWPSLGGLSAMSKRSSESWKKLIPVRGPLRASRRAWRHHAHSEQRRLLTWASGSCAWSAWIQNTQARNEFS